MGDKYYYISKTISCYDSNGNYQGAFFDGKCYDSNGNIVDKPWGKFVPKWFDNYQVVLVTGWSTDQQGHTKIYGKDASSLVKIVPDKKVWQDDKYDEKNHRLDIFNMSRDKKVLMVGNIELDYIWCGDVVKGDIVKSFVGNYKSTYLKAYPAKSYYINNDKDVVVWVKDSGALDGTWFDGKDLNPIYPEDKHLADMKEISLDDAIKVIDGWYDLKDSKNGTPDHQLGVPQGAYAEDAGIYGWDLD